MDPKASARAKRAQSLKGKSKFHTKHSQSRQESHQQQKSNEIAESEISNVSKNIKEKNPRKKGLASNWDRYENLSPEEGDDRPVISKTDGTVPIKSKGADYSFLLSHFQDQTAFDLYPTGFEEGYGSALHVKGQNILSWGEDDNFFLNNHADSSNFQASFVSVDLNGLATQLAQLDLSKRLFIEEDLLPAKRHDKHEEGLFQDKSSGPKEPKFQPSLHQLEITEAESSSRHGNQQCISGQEVYQGVNQRTLSVSDSLNIDASSKNISDTNFPSLETPVISAEAENSLEEGKFTRVSPVAFEVYDDATAYGIKTRDSQFHPSAAESELDALLNEDGSSDAHISHGQFKNFGAEHANTMVDSYSISTHQGKTAAYSAVKTVSTFGSSLYQAEYANKGYKTTKFQANQHETDHKSVSVAMQDCQAAVRSFDAREAEAELDALLGDVQESGFRQLNMNGQRPNTFQEQKIGAPSSLLKMEDSLDDLLNDIGESEPKDDMRNMFAMFPHSTNKSLADTQPSFSKDDIDTFLDSV